MASLSDVAARGGVSIRTVRRVLYEPDLVAAKTVARVTAALQELDYVPHPYARALGGGKSDAVALIVPQLIWYVGNILVVTLQQQIAALGLHGVFFVSEGGSAAQRVAEIRRLSPQAVMLVQVDWDEAYRGLLGNGTVVVGIDVQPQMPDEVPFDAIGVDRVGAFRSATEHLLELGHRRIGLLNYYSGRGRVEGYTAAMEAAGLEYRAIQMADAEGIHAPPIRTALEKLLAEHPDLTGIVCTTDQYTAPVVRHLADMGLRVPHDMSLTSYSNEPWTEWTMPALTTLDQRTDLLCAHALEAMQRRLGACNEPWIRQIIRPALIVRESTAPPR
jgi:LacI family transcriptional regulator